MYRKILWERALRGYIVFPKIGALVIYFEMNFRKGRLFEWSLNKKGSYSIIDKDKNETKNSRDFEGGTLKNRDVFQLLNFCMQDYQ